MANASSTVTGQIEIDSSYDVDATFEELVSMLTSRRHGGPTPPTVNRIASGERARCRDSEMWSTTMTVLADTRQVEADFHQEYVAFNRRLSIVRASR